MKKLRNLRESCEDQITSNECYNARKNFKAGETSGSDGFPAEFYYFLWPEVNKEMTESFNLFRVQISEAFHKPKKRSLYHRLSKRLKTNLC